jgi:hypothetical protein
MRRIVAGIVAVVTTVAAVVACSDTSRPTATAPSALGPSYTKAEKVTICHAAGLAGTTHFITITLSANGLKGHFENDGTPKAGHELDFLVTATHLCPGPVAAQLTICKALGRGTNDGRSFAFTTSTGEAFTLHIGECFGPLDVEPGAITVTERGEIPAAGSFFATAITTIPVIALGTTSGVVTLRTDLPPGVETSVVGVVATTSGNLTKITFVNSN